MSRSPPTDRETSVLAELGEAYDDPRRAAAAEPQPFVLGTETHVAAMPLGGLERIGERAARGLRAVFDPYARARCTATAEPLETCRFESWRAGLPAFTSASHYRATALKGGFLVAFDPEFVTRLVDAFYGGNGGINAHAPRATEFTAGEERIAARLADAIAETLAAAWAELAPLQPVAAERETGAAHVTLVRGDEMVVVQRFAVDAGPCGLSPIDLVYPLAALKAHPALAGGTKRPAATPGDAEFRFRLANALEQVQLPVRSVLARPTLSVHELLSLKVGDVIPITLGPRVPLLVANRRVAEGTIGEQEGRAALMIEAIEADA